VWLLGLVMLGVLSSCSASPPRPKVLIIGLDGARPDVLARVNTPRIDSLIAAGAYTGSARTGLPTVSGPGWSSMLIGVWPEKHGVTSNDFSSNRYDLYPNILSRVESLRPELNTMAAADWLPLVAPVDGGPLIGDDIDAKIVIDGYDIGWLEADRRIVDSATVLLREADPDLAFVYLGSPDEASHEAHSIGVEYQDAIAMADVLVGRLLDAVRARPTYPGEDWLVLMSTDHGRRADGDHGGDTPEERTIFLLASGPSVQPGAIPDSARVVDVAVTALAHLGVPIDEAWALDGHVVAGWPESGPGGGGEGGGGR
jgi:predicted AlkP superfamily pyrophosphatase or phosphodiesterase